MTGTASEPSRCFRLPDDLTERDQWVLWSYAKVNGRLTKVPYRVGGGAADITDPRTWATYEEALNVWRRNRQRYAGLGFVFSKGDPFVGLDLDDSLNEQGHVKAWARGIVERFADTYTEVSPGGAGLKIWARGSLPRNLPGVKVVDGQIELYDHARYFTVTGRAFRGSPLEIEDHASDLVALYERLSAGRKGWRLQPCERGRIPYGQQHNTLVSFCGTLRARGVCEEAIEACLQIVNEQQCEKPGPRANVTRIVKSSRRWLR
jgi:hypothetical protein